MECALITALDESNGIGKNGTLPWHLPEDMKYFSELTKGTEGQQNAVIMGRVTWESIPQKFRPLPDRINVVISRNTKYPVPDGVVLAGSLSRAFDLLSDKSIDTAFVIGGSSIYEQALAHPACTTLYITEICDEFSCDAFFPKIDPDEFTLTEESDLKTSVKGHPFRYLVYKRIK